ncbi:MAG: hypothetical protein DHS20C11_01730 [Lysobacteraceae bacterium]|nr:MAG: hypothetical protein DHS20C11_01730 [Xanthomonadaceae bacterium]
MSKLVDLMKDLGQDASLANEYQNDADGVMKRYGLSDEECAAMKSCDVDKIKQMSGLSDVHVTTNSTIKAFE